MQHLCEHVTATPTRMIGTPAMMGPNGPKHRHHRLRTAAKASRHGARLMHRRGRDRPLTTPAWPMSDSMTATVEALLALAEDEGTPRDPAHRSARQTRLAGAWSHSMKEMGLAPS